MNDTTYSAFDPVAFLDAQQTEINEYRQPLPVENPQAADGCYIAVIGEPKADSGTIGKGDRTGQPWLSFNLPLVIDIPQQLQDSLKLPAQLTLYDRAFIDLTPDGKSIDNSPGRNRVQKAYREALGLNVPGTPFSWRMVQGRPVKIKIAWRMVPTPDGSQRPVEEVSAVLKA